MFLEIITAIVISLLTHPPAGTAMADCGKIADGAPRLACYDTAQGLTPAPAPQASQATPAPAPAAPEASKKVVPAEPPQEPPPVTTRDIITAIPPGEFKVADASDLYVAPRKFLHRPIEIRHTHCYYADLDDYRCILPPGAGVVAVFAGKVEPADAKARLEGDCGTMREMTSPKCERTIRLMLDDYGEDQVSGNQNRVILKPETILIAAAASPKRRK